MGAPSRSLAGARCVESDTNCCDQSAPLRATSTTSMLCTQRPLCLTAGPSHLESALTSHIRIVSTTTKIFIITALTAPPVHSSDLLALQSA